MPPRGQRSSKTPTPAKETTFNESTDDGGVATITMDSPALSQEMGAMLDGPGAQWEGGPYYDPTLNFLHFRWQQVELENMRTLDKIDKLENHSKGCVREMNTIAALLKAEFEKREIINPSTGEKIERPFQTYT